MKIIPYRSVGKLDFGTAEAVTVSLLGAAQRHAVNRQGENELHYDGAVFRFAPGVGLVECSGKWHEISFNSATIPAIWIERYIRQNDPDARESVGFLISPTFGVSVDLEHSGWISAFVKGRWDQFLR